MPTTSWQSPECQHHHHEAQNAFDTFISSTNGKHFRIYAILAELGSFYIQTDAVFHDFIGIFGSTVLKPLQLCTEIQVKSQDTWPKLTQQRMFPDSIRSPTVKARDSALTGT